MRPDLLRNHSTEDMDFSGVASAMVSNGFEAFQGQDGFVLDVLDLKVDGEGESQAESKGDGPGQASSAEQSTPVKQKIWVERDKQVSAAHRMATVALDNFVTKCERQHKRQSDEFEELMGGFSEEDRPKFLGEIRTYEVRLEALGLVLTTNNAGEEKLKQFIGRFASAHHGETEGAAVAALELGQGPPCESYLQLRQLRASLEALIEKYHTCAQPKMLKDSLCVCKAQISQCSPG